MNDRIKELAAKSNFGHMENGEVVYDHRLEKFAELIVQECNLYACSAWEHGPLLGKDLLIHFGIKIHSDKDYEIGTIEECEKFAESRRKPFGKNE
jgi:hypothetical protein